jgi:hypothetical protein
MFEPRSNAAAFRCCVLAGTLFLAAGCNKDVSPSAGPTPEASDANPSSPTGLVATSGNAQASLTWAASSSATGYDVKRSSTSGGPYTSIATPTSNAYVDATAANGTTYYYVVSAVNSRGTSPVSAQVSATPFASTPPVTTPPIVTPPETPPVVTPPSTPPVVTPPVTPPVTGQPSGPTFNFTSAPALNGVTVVQNRDSVIIKVPAVANARDFRVLVQPASVAANSNGTESVTGGTQFCGGVLQHASRTRFVADPVSLVPWRFYANTGLINPNTLVANFFGNGAPTPWKWFDLDPPPHREIEVTGVTSNMTVTVEAVDRLCPFPGMLGRQHADINLSHGDLNHPDNPWLDGSGVITFPVVTKAEVISRYGSLIVNGQGWAGGPNVQANPPLAAPFAQPAPPNPPIVLARTSISIAPLASPPPAPSGFFDDFSNPNDTFVVQPAPNWKYKRSRSSHIVTQNSKWTVYGDGFSCCQLTSSMDGRGYFDTYIEDGMLRSTLGDWAQDIFSEISMFPRKAAHLSSTNYLHVTYEVPSFATGRRYWIFSLCGSSTPGQTLDSSGVLKEQVVHATFFYTTTGMSPSTAGWNCLQVLNREGSSSTTSQWESMYNLKGQRPPVPPKSGVADIRGYIYNSIADIANPSKVAAYTVHPESDVVVLVNKRIPEANLPEIGGTNDQVVSGTASTINVSPMQLDSGGMYAWFFKVDTNGNPVAPILDDQQLVSPRTKYDLYIRNNRLIMYVNGRPALCNNFNTPTTTLNIADAAVGFHHVLYHSSGEFVERFVDPDRGAAYHYRYNSPFLDQRTWDNIGFQENVAAPSDFDAQTCFEHASRGPENNEP